MTRFTPNDVTVETAHLPLMHDCWEEFKQQWVASQIEPWQSRLRKLLQSRASIFGHAICLIAQAPGYHQPLGAAVLDLPHFDTPPGFRSGWLAHVWVAPEVRGMRIATRIVEQSVVSARLRGCDRLMLATSKAFSPDCLYRVAGFQEVESSTCLMRLNLVSSFESSALTNSRTHARLPLAFTVGADDLGGCASVAARECCTIVGDAWSTEAGIDVEELLCSRLHHRSVLGHLLYANHDEFGAVGLWVLHNDNDTLKIIAAASQGFGNNPVPSLRSLAESIPVADENFTYLLAHESVA